MMAWKKSGTKTVRSKAEKATLTVTKRASVRREERCAATPETLAKLRPWTMQELLRRGPDDGGLSSEQFEAAVAIAEAFRFITGLVGFKPLDLGRIGVGGGGVGSAGERRIAIYRAWGNSVQGIDPDAHLEPSARERAMRIECARLAGLSVRPHIIVEWIEDERPIDSHAVALIARACTRWRDIADRHDAERSRQKRREEIAAGVAC